MKNAPPTLTKRTADECKSDVYNRYFALNAARLGTGPVDPVLLKGCQSMMSLAFMESPKHQIRSFGSRNTLFKYANIVLVDDSMKTPTGENGLKFLDWLRVQVKSRGEKFQSARTGIERTNRARKREEDFSKDLQELRTAMSSMTRAYNRLLKDVKALSEDRSTIPGMKLRLHNLIDEHTELFGDLFLPRPSTTSQPSNLVSIRTHEIL